MSLGLDKTTWETVRFGDVVVQSKASVDPSDGSVDRYIAGEHMDTDDLQIHRWGEVGDGYLGPAFHRKFEPGQILYGSRRTYLRKVAVAEFDGVTANTTFVVETADEAQLLQAFLPWVMSSERFHAFAVAESKGSVNPYINFSDLARFEFALPPLDVQRRLADLLWSVEHHRRQLWSTLQVARSVESEVLRSAFRSEWCRASVSELGDVQLGQQLHPKYRSGPNMKPYLRVANVGDNHLDLSDVAEMDFSDRGAEKFRLEPGDILLNEGQSIELVGRCAMFRGEIVDCYMQKTLLRFRAGPTVLPEFALAWFRRCFVLGHFASMARRTSSMAHLTAVRFAAMPMPYPPRTEQLRVIDNVNDVVSGLECIGLEMTTLTDLRATLLAEVLG